MDAFTALSQALAAGLSIWNNKEARKYQDKLIALKKDYYEEYNKDISNRNDAILDNLQFELRLIAIAFATDVGKQDVKN